MVTIRHPLIFQSCFQIELDQNNNKEACISSQFFLCIDHYKKYKKFKPQLECCICDKSIYSKRFVGILGIVFLMCMLKARSKTLWLPYSFSSKYSCFPNPSFFINLFKKNYLIGFFFVLTIKIMPPRSSRKNKVNFKF